MVKHVITYPIQANSETIKAAFTVCGFTNGVIYFLPAYMIRIKIKSTTSLVKDSHGVNLIASPKQPQSVTLLK